jgi:hypothetical protein
MIGEPGSLRLAGRSLITSPLVYRSRGMTIMTSGLGIDLPLLGYGLGTGYDDGPECTGYWHRHNSGRLDCHGHLLTRSIGRIDLLAIRL